MSKNSNSDLEQKKLRQEENFTDQAKDQSPENWRSLFVVGDDAQSIYSFRGSKIEIILKKFTENYPKTTKLILNQNYRSTQNILDLAEQVLSHNPKQTKKGLFTENKSQIPVYIYTAKNEKDEAEYILRQIYLLYEKSVEKDLNNENSSLDKPVNKSEKDSFSLLLEKLSLDNLDQKL